MRTLSSIDLRSFFRRIDPNIYIILFLPLVQLCIKSDWNYGPVQSIDTWIYYGYFRNFRQHLVEYFPGTYYGTRLPWILPGYMCYTLFQPIIANAILHISFYYLAILSLYVVLKHTTNPNTAILACILAACHSIFLGAIGWDYMDGPIITYYLMTMAALTYAVIGVRAKLWLCLAGVFYSAMVYCTLTTVIFSFTFLIYYILASRALRGNAVRGSILKFIPSFLLGIAVLTLLLGIINRAVGGPFLFYAPSIRFAMGMMGQANPWASQDFAWLSYATWLIFPALTCLGCIFSLILDARAPSPRIFPLAGFFAWNFVGSFVIYVLLRMNGLPLLEFDYFVSWLIPAMFLAIGAQFCVISGPVNTKVFLLFIGSVFAAFTWPLLGIGFDMSQSILNKQRSLLVPLACGVIGCFIRGIFRRSWTGLVIFLLALSISHLFVVPIVRGCAWDTKHDEQDAFLRITSGMDSVQSMSTDSRPLFWYDRLEVNGIEYRALASTYLWGWTLVNDEFPSAKSAQPIAPGSLIVIPSDRHDILDRANESLGKINFRARLLKRQEISRAGVSYTLTYVELKSLEPSWQRPITITVDGMMAIGTQEGVTSAFPPDRWMACYPPDNMSLKLMQDGLRVTTAARRWGYAAIYPALTAPNDAEFKFVLKYKLLSGGITFGALSADQSKWIVQAGPALHKDGFAIKEFSIKMKAGEKLVPLIANDFPGGDGASSFTVYEFSAFCFKP